MLRLTLVCAILPVLFVVPASAQGDCQQVKITCSEAKKQNEGYCSSDRRTQTGMSYEGCIASGEKAMKDCLQTGRWVSGRRNLCGLTKQ